MNDPFKNRAPSLSGPATDIQPVTPADGVPFGDVALALYVETGGAVAFVTAAGQARIVQVADFSILPVGVREVSATGTTASGIHAMVLA
ncbi:MAG: spike base protein, RCAP_Rcc01079 family [Paracoccaceae bacterium]